MLYITWNIAVRRLYDLPRTAHTRFLSHIAGVPHVNLNLKCRFAKILYKAINSQIEIITFLANDACITLCQLLAMSLTCCVNINMSDIINGSSGLHLGGSPVAQ